MRANFLFITHGPSDGLSPRNPPLPFLHAVNGRAGGMGDAASSAKDRYRGCIETSGSLTSVLIYGTADLFWSLALLT